MKEIAMIMLLICLSVFNSFAQNVGDYRTSSSGDWNVPATWEQFNGTAWIPAVSVPTSANGQITSQAIHVLTIPDGYTVVADQLVVHGQLVIEPTGKLTLANGTGTDLTLSSASSNAQVFGDLQRSQGSTIDNSNVSSRLTFQSGSDYLHAYTVDFGDLPIASWDANSTITLQGFTNTVEITADNSWAQSVGNVIFHSTGQRAPVNFVGQLTNIRGNLTLSATGNSYVQLSGGESPTFNVDGNLTVSGTSRLVVSTTGTTTLNIAGNFNFTSTTSAGSFTTYTGTTTINLSGDFNMSAGNGRFRLANAGTTGLTTINFFGNFNLVSGRLDEVGSGAARGDLRFVGNGARTFFNTGRIVGSINYYISAATTLDAGTSPFVGSPSSFTLDGTLIVGSNDPLGAIQLSNTEGNIRTTVSQRFYNNGSVVIYRGSGPMYMASGQPSGQEVTTILDNAAGVTLASNATINGSLQLADGLFSLGNFALTTSTGFTYNGGTFGGTSLSSLIISGTTGGNWGTITFDPTANQIGTLTINRTGASASATINGTVQVATALNLTNGTLNNVSGLNVLDGAVVTRYSTAALTGAAIQIPAGAYSVVYRTTTPSGGPFANINTSAELPTNSTNLSNLTIMAAQNGDAVTLTQNIFINGNLTITRGTLMGGAFNITMQGTGSWVDNGGAFNPGTGTVIFAGATTIGGTSDPTLGSFQIASSSSAQFTRNFSFSGDLQFGVNATFDVGNFTVTLNGGNQQTLSPRGQTFHNVTIAKSGGADVALTSGMMVTGLIQFSSPSANVALISNGMLTLVSTSDTAGSGTGMIYRLTGGNSVTGDVTLNRYISGGEGMIYRYISSPVSNAMVSQWKDDFDITGPFLDPTARHKVCGVYTNPASPSLFYYNEAVAGDVNQGYVSYPLPGNSTTNSPIQVGRGYAAFIRECTEPTIIDVTGPINHTAVSLPVTYTSSMPEADGYNLVGNPFPCTIDWDQGSWTKTRISPIISITDNGSGMVRYYESGVTNDIPNGQIAPGQAFFVRATGASPSLIVRENSKVSTVVEFFREATPHKTSFALAFSDGTNTDRTYVKLEEGATETLDDLDAPKIKNRNFSFYTLASDNTPMAINALKQLECTSTFRLMMEGVAAGSYSINLERRPSNFKGYNFTLVDNFLKREINITNARYAFEVSADPLSKAADRFTLRVESPDQPQVLSVNQVMQQDEVTFTATTDSDGTFYWYDQAVGGEPVHVGDSYTVSSHDGKPYFVAVMNAGGCMSGRVSTGEVRDQVVAGIAYYPNPVQRELWVDVFSEDVIQLAFVNLLGQVLFVQPVTELRQYTIDVSSWPDGIYLMDVSTRSKKRSIRIFKD